MRALVFLTAALVVLLMTAPLRAVENADANWHQWRGPNANGTASHGDPPVAWSPEQNIKWKKAIPGRGNATPIVWGDKLFVLTAVDTGQPDPNAAPAAEAAAADSDSDRRGFGRFGGDSGPRNVHQFIVLCLDRNSGDVLWQKVARESTPHEGKHGDNTYASGSPTTDGERLYVSFGSQGIFCYDLEGNPVWERDLGNLQTRHSFGEGASPTIHKDALVVPWDQETGSKLYVLDAATGDTRWAKDRDEVTTWNTPLVVEAAGKTQIIINGDNRIRSYDLATGEVIWECGGLGTNPIPMPVVFENLVYCMTGHREPAGIAVPLDSQGDVTDSDKVAWRTTQGTPYVPSPLLVGDRLYYTKGNNAVLSSINARTGEAVIDQKRIPGLQNIYASPVAAQGRMYFTGRDGTTVVLRDGDAIDVLATNAVGEPVDASPAIVGDTMYIRGVEHLFCIGGQ
ncbi:MAG TPA: PQQ-binding-like beta-propeller repeat protein [Lacipirellula sp.]